MLGVSVSQGRTTRFVVVSAVGAQLGARVPYRLRIPAMSIHQMTSAWSSVTIALIAAVVMG
jgi:hypothetical protein